MPKTDCGQNTPRTQWSTATTIVAVTSTRQSRSRFCKSARMSRWSLICAARWLSTAARARGWKVDEMRVEAGRLDEVFRTITSPDTVAAATSSGGEQ